MFKKSSSCTFHALWCISRNVLRINPTPHSQFEEEIIFFHVLGLRNSDFAKVYLHLACWQSWCTRCSRTLCWRRTQHVWAKILNASEEFIVRLLHLRWAFIAAVRFVPFCTKKKLQWTEVEVNGGSPISAILTKLQFLSSVSVVLVSVVFSYY